MYEFKDINKEHEFLFVNFCNEILVKAKYNSADATSASWSHCHKNIFISYIITPVYCVSKFKKYDKILVSKIMNRKNNLSTYVI